MLNITSQNKILLITGIGIVLIIFLLAGIVFYSLTANPPQAPDQITPGATTSVGQHAELQVLSITPQNAIPLTPNKKQTFTLLLSRPDDVVINITAQDVTAEKSQSVQFTSSFSPDKKTITLTTFTPLNPASRYTITILDSKTNEQIFHTIYTSQGVSPTRVPSNNPSLSQYLPYETNTYALSYIKERNVYIFNFKFNPSSSDTLDTQYSKAQDAAVAFIKSKGIDMSSIVIEWKLY